MLLECMLELVRPMMSVAHGEKSGYAVYASPALTMLADLSPLGETVVHRVAFSYAFHDF